MHQPIALLAPALLIAQPAADPGKEALALIQQARELQAKGKGSEALPLAQRAAEALERHRPGSRELGQALQLAASLQAAGGQKREAVSTYQRARQVLAQAGDRATEAAVLRSLGIVFYDLKDFPKSEASFQECLALLTALRDAPALRNARSNLATTVLATGRLREAEGLLEALAAECREAKDERVEVVCVNNLAAAYGMQGRFRDTIRVTERSLALARAMGNKNHEVTALINLASAHTPLGLLPRAMELLQEAMQVAQAIPSKPMLGTVWFLLSANHHRLGNTPKALACMAEAMKLREELKDVRGLARCHVNLGVIQNDLGKNEEALASYQKAEALYRSLPDKLDLVQALANVGSAHRRLGALGPARTALEEALALAVSLKDGMRENASRHELALVLQDQHETGRVRELLLASQAGYESRGLVNEKARCTLDLARFLSRTGQAVEAEAQFVALAQHREESFHTLFAVLSERERLLYTRTFEGQVHAHLEHARSAKGDPRAAFDAWLAFKGRVLETQGRLQTAILASPDPALRDLAGRLQSIRMDLAGLLQTRPSGLSPAEHQARLTALREQKESLERDLAQRSRLFASDQKARQVTSRTLAALLPKDTAVLDFARIRPVVPETGKVGEARYVVFLQRAGRAPRLLDLGPAESTDALAQALLRDLAAGAPVEEGLAPLRARLLDPLKDDLKGLNRVLVCPDGELSRLPFELFLPPAGPRMSYLTSSQDIARFQDPKGTSRVVAVLAAPDFGPAPGAPSATRAGTVFQPLPGTLEEARAIARLHGKDCRLWTGAQADAAALETLEAPRILHVATHGFAMPRVAEREDLALESPMARTGLALAGANGGGGKGLLSAAALLDLRLQGTELVTLSTCSSGVGKVLDGEGVFGLRRALTLAGARSLLVSLWPVPDAATRDLMTAFYQGLAKGRPKAEALADAKRSVARKHPHPRNWAAFVLVGNPT